MRADDFLFSTGGNWTEVECLLDLWFTAGETRTSVLPFDGSKFSQSSAQLAGKIFKRGGKGIRDIAEGNREVRFPSPTDVPSQNSIARTEIHHHSSLAHWLASSPLWQEGTVVVCDTRVAELHPALVAFLSERSIPVLEFTCSESTKSLSSVRALLQRMNRVPKKVVAVGGGVCCDVAGFVGGLLECQVHLVPTTLLAMVDAGLGGKTGVNHPRAGKNQIGLFVPLHSVTLVREFLSTLPPTLVRQGLGEMLKHAWLGGCFELWKQPLAWLADSASAVDVAHSHLSFLLEENVAFKQRVVALDPHEHSVRVLLNFGHTVAHLLEAMPESLHSTNSQTPVPPPIPHGLAVALGQITFLKSGLISAPDDSFLNALENLFQHETIPLPWMSLAEAAAVCQRILRQDKKNLKPSAETVRCVIPRYGCLALTETHSDSFDEQRCMQSNTAEIPFQALLESMKQAGIFE